MGRGSVDRWLHSCRGVACIGAALLSYLVLSAMARPVFLTGIQPNQIGQVTTHGACSSITPRFIVGRSRSCRCWPRCFAGASALGHELVRIGKLTGNDFVLLGVEDLSYRKVSAFYPQAWWCRVRQDRAPARTPFDDGDEV